MKKTIKIKKILLACTICNLIILSGVNSGCIKNILTDKNDQSPWPRFQADQYATGYSKYLGPQTNNVKWRFSINGWSSSPIIGPDDTLYFGDDSSSFHALSPDGREKWSFRLPASDPPPDLEPDEREAWLDQERGAGFATHAPAIGDDGTLYFGVTFHPHEDPDGAELGLYALNPDGTKKWFFSTDEDVTSSINIAPDGTIYFAATDIFYGLNPDGTLKWIHPLEEGIAWSSPAIGNDGTIYVVGEALLALNPDGNLKWSYVDDSPDGIIGGFAAHPTIGNDNTIYFGSGKKFYAINSDGTEKWVIDFYWTESSPAIGNDGTIYIGTGARAFYALDPVDGSTKWSFPIKTWTDGSPAIDADGTIYFGSDEGFFYALNPDGTLKWKLDVGHVTNGEIDTSPAIGRDGTLYFGHAGGPGDTDGLWFYAVGTDDNQSNSVKIVAPPNGGCYLGAYNWGDDGVQTFEQVLGRKVAIGNPYSINDGGCENTWPSFDTHGHEQNWQAGYVTWTGIETALGWAAPKFIPQDVIDGEIDSYLTQMAEDIRDWGRPIFWMYPREPGVQPGSGYDGGGYGPNGDLLDEEAITQGYSSTAEYGDPEKLDGPERYIDMCRHIHDVVVPIAPNVTWVMGAVVTQAWVENRVSGTYEKYYPGDVYVDWHAFDIYGWSDNSDDPESPLDAGFFTNIIEPGWSEAVTLAPDKPIMIVEFGVYANVASGDDRSKWFNNFFQAAKSTYSQVGAFIYWQSSGGSDDTGIYTGIYPGDLAEGDIFNEMKGPDAGWWLSSVVTSSIIEVEIIKPKENYLYVSDQEIMPTIFHSTIIIGGITVETNVLNESSIDRVEFYVDDELKFVDEETPYEWLWDERVFSTHDVKVIAYDNEGNTAKDKIDTIIFNLGG